MKKLLAFLFFISAFSLFTCEAQNHVADSLKQVLKTLSGDTNKVNTLIALSNYLYHVSKYDSSIFYANSALSLASRLGFESGMGRATKLKGHCYENEGDNINSLNNYGESISIFEKIGNKTGIVGCLNGMGNVYTNLGSFPKALEYYYKALAIAGQIKDTMRAALQFANIGSIYQDQHNYSKALQYDFMAYGMHQKMRNKNYEIYDLLNIGEAYLEQKKYDTAQEYLFKALEISHKVINRDEGSILTDIGETYTGMGKYDTALKYEFNALSYIRQTGVKVQYCNALNNIGGIYSKKKKYPLSKVYLDSALLLSKEIGDKKMTMKVYANREVYDSATGNLKAEIQDHRFVDIYSDSLNELKTFQEEMNYDFDRKQDSLKAEQTLTNAVKENEIKNQKRIKNYVLGGLGLVLLFLGFVVLQRNRISKEKTRSDNLLLNILPSEVAEELKAKGSAEAKQFDVVTVMFTDFKGFTTIAEKLSAKELVAEIDYCFKGFDNIIHKYNIEKIKTIGDSYMAAGGLPVANNTHAKDVVNAALEIVQFMEAHKQQRSRENKPVFEIRIGINTGSVVAGIVGVKKFAYDIWGDTVNLASRMESSGEPGKVNISGSTYELVKNDFTCTYRGKIQAKNKGEVDMYFVS